MDRSTDRVTWGITVGGQGVAGGGSSLGTRVWGLYLVPGERSPRSASSSATPVHHEALLTWGSEPWCQPTVD